MNAKNITQRRINKKSNAGFTLIELVMVIVILGILSAVALPKFVDLSGHAKKASAAGIAGALASGSFANFAAKKLDDPNAIALDSASICTANLGNQKYIANVLAGNKLPDGYTLTGKQGADDCSDPAISAATCIVTSDTGEKAEATITCAR